VPGSGNATSYVVQGREVTMPVVVRDASSMAATYVVNSAQARKLLPTPELEVVEVFPGQALFSIACVEYLDNDLGRYNEVALALFVRERGARPLVPWIGSAFDFLLGRLATYIVHLPVTQSFTCDAGLTIWGFPKTVQQIEFSDIGRRRRCMLAMHGSPVLSFTSHRGGWLALPEMTMATYSYVRGVLHKTTFVPGASEVGICVGGVELVLGGHPVSAELRRLGLPRPALLSVSMRHQHARFDAPIAIVRR
jgi:hypothetical protein